MIADEWIRESMPPDWGIARVKDHVRVINGYPFDSKLFAADAGHPLVRIRDIFNSETVVNYGGDWIPEAAITTGDILVGMDGDFNIARWKGGDALLNQRVCCIRTVGGIDPGYLYYALPDPLKLINEFTYSTTVKHLSSFDVLDIRLPYPPIEQQKLIANYLDRETDRIDGLISEKQRMLELLEEKSTALISSVVARGLDPNAPLTHSGQEWLGDIPAHWRLERLKFHLLGLEQGWSPQCDNYPAEPDDWGVLKVGAVNAWSFNPLENKRLPDEVEPLLEYEIKQHDVLMSRANTTQLLGSIVYVNELSSKLLLCDKLYRLNSNDDQLDREFLVAFLRANPGRFQLEREASGSSGSMQNIGQDTVQNAWIAIPPLDEQKKISAYISDFRRKTEKMSVDLRRTVDLLRERRGVLITAAVTGRIPLEEMTG